MLFAVGQAFSVTPCGFRSRCGGTPIAKAIIDRPVGALHELPSTVVGQRSSLGFLPHGRLLRGTCAWEMSHTQLRKRILIVSGHIAR